MVPVRNLSLKFTLILLAVLVLGVALSWAALSHALLRRAQEEVDSKGQVLLQTMNSVRDYTSAHVNPLLAPSLESEAQFIPESVPAFSAHAVFENLQAREGYENYAYKEAALNPTNPEHRADPFEQGILEQFRANAALTELSGYRTLDGERLFYSARPLTIQSESCLRCHGEPAAAPASLLATYGDEHGFGWQMGETIAAQMIYVPAEDVLQSASASFTLAMAIFLAVFAAAILLINLLLRQNVIRPVGMLGGLAEKIGEGSLTAADLGGGTLAALTTREDEVGQLSRLFQKMAREVMAREERLKQEIQELRIEVDEKKREAQVAEITETEYFQDLQTKARELRAQRHRQHAGGQHP